MNGNPAVDRQGKLVFDTSAVARKRKGNRGGPPNRMNDLAYRDWMKFQKSFFRFSSDQVLIEECVHFFTKAVWGDGTASRTLIVGADEFSPDAIASPRVVTHVAAQNSFETVTSALRVETTKTGLHDFVLVDLRALITEPAELDDFINLHAERFFGALRGALRDDRYGCVMVGLPQDGGGGFPFPWSVALSARGHLRLRDEKIGLIEDEGRVFYCLFMQANEDARPREMVTNDSLRLSDRKLCREVPAWIIPEATTQEKERNPASCQVSRNAHRTVDRDSLLGDGQRPSTRWSAQAAQ